MEFSHLSHVSLRYIVYPFLTENSLVFNLHVLQKVRITAGKKIQRILLRNFQSPTLNVAANGLVRLQSCNSSVHRRKSDILNAVFATRFDQLTSVYSAGPGGMIILGGCLEMDKRGAASRGELFKGNGL